MVYANSHIRSSILAKLVKNLTAKIHNGAYSKITMTRILYEQSGRRTEIGMGGSIPEKMARSAGVMAPYHTVETLGDGEDYDDREVVSTAEGNEATSTSKKRSLGAKALVSAVRQE